MLVFFIYKYFLIYANVNRAGLLTIYADFIVLGAQFSNRFFSPNKVVFNIKNVYYMHLIFYTVVY